MSTTATTPPVGFLGTRRPGVYKLDTRTARAEKAAAEWGKDMKHRAKQAKRAVYKPRPKVAGNKATRPVKVAGRAAAVVTRAVAGTVVVVAAGTYLTGRQVAKHGGRAYRTVQPVVRKVAGHAGRKIDAYAAVYVPVAVDAVKRKTAKPRAAAAKAKAGTRATAQQAKRAAAQHTKQAQARARNAARNARQKATATATAAATTAYAKGRTRKARAFMKVAAYMAPRGSVESSMRGSVTRTGLGQAQKATATAKQWAAAIDSENAAIDRARAHTATPPTPPPAPAPKVEPPKVGPTRPLPHDHPARRPAPTSSGPTGSGTRTTAATSSVAGTGGASHNNRTEGNTMSGALAVQQFRAAFGNLNAVEPDTYHDWLYTLVGTANAFRAGSELTLGLALRMDIAYKMDTLALQRLYLASPALSATSQLIAGAARDFYSMYQDRIDPAPMRGRTMKDEDAFFGGRK